MRATHRRLQWKGFRSIVCGIDFSDQSRVALQYAGAVALRAGARMRVVFANDPLLTTALAAGHDPRAAERSLVELNAFVADAVSAEAQQALDVTTRAPVGLPADVLLRHASGFNADLIVLGTHGATGLDRLLLGSTTLAVLQRSAIPVLAVPVRDGGKPDSSPRGIPAAWPGSAIAAAIELGPDARRHAANAATIAEWFGSSLVLVHIVPSITPPRWFEGNLGAFERDRALRAQGQVHTLARSVARRVATATHVRHGQVDEELASFVAAGGAQLLITTLHDRSGWFGAKRGATSYHVLSRASVPVLACPPRWRPALKERR